MAKDNIQLVAANSSGLTNGNLKKRINHNNHSSSLQTKTMNGKLSSMSIEEQFNAAVEVVQNLPKNGSFQPSDQLKLKFYAFYKQAKEGPNRTPKPSFYEIIARYKWDAWSKLGDMSNEDAMKNYVNELKQIIDTMPYNESSEDFYDKLGPFYEFKKEKSNQKVNGDSNQHKSNGNQLTNDANYSSSSDSSSESDDFSDTVDNLSVNGDSKPNRSNSNENGFVIKNQHFENENQHCFEDCTDVNSKLNPSDVINAKGIDAGYLTGQENYFYDCIDKNSVLNPNDIICARGETGIFSRTNLPSNQEQSSGSRTTLQPLSYDNTGFRSDDSFFNQGAGGSGNGGDRNFSSQNSDLNDIHEHLALTVLRLQQTVKSISNRIENLETKVNERQIENAGKEIKKVNWWSSRTTQTTVLLILWPFAAHLIISAIKKKVNK